MAAIVEEAPAAVVVVAGAPAAEVVAEAPPAEVVPEAPAAEVVVETPPAPPAPAASEAEAPAKPAAATGTPIPAGATVKLVVQRGLKIGEEYTLFAGENFVGRADEKPVDVDLTFQEPEDRVWCSRQHALLVYDDAAGTLTVEDLNSSNGTFVNRERVYPGQPRQLFVGNTVQIGTVHMRVKV
ncbi:MAG: FHA domain-containing protein [Gemmataceae bacterium]|nr:FHA domain-containing protein [Gemmataceae bacterium]